MKMSRALIPILKLIFTILLLFLVFQSIDVSKITHDLRAFNLRPILVLLAICWLGQLLCSERWRIFASAMQMQGSYLSFVQMYFIGMFFNIGLPSLIGGDAIKAYILSRKNGKPLYLGLASVLQDRAAGLISLLIYGSVAILLHPILWKGFSLWTAYLLSWIAVAFVLWLVLKGDRLYRRFIVPESASFFQKMLKMIAEFQQALGMSRLKTSGFLRITLYSFINSGLVLWIFRQVTVAAGYKIDFIPFSGLFPLVILATMLPVTLSGLGVREWVYVEALILVGVPRGPGLIISLATSALILLCNLAGIIFLPCIPMELWNRACELRKNRSERP
ncbi:MAG: flippase-like domain-containing protein [Acidobacteria bacterium]|nr:flippase-like domain-containing protein [Acidobacteriota bacterium]